MKEVCKWSVVWKQLWNLSFIHFRAMFGFMQMLSLLGYQPQVEK